MRTNTSRLGVALAASLAVQFFGTANAESLSEQNRVTDDPEFHWSTYCDVQDIVPILQPIEGRAKLCVSSRGLRARIDGKNFAPGEAYTVWWIYFDDPGACIVPNECGLADFEGENPLAVFGRMDSAVAPRRGRIRFSDRLRAMEPTSGSQIWLLVFGHGAANFSDGRQLARQLLTPEDPNAGTPHLGNSIDGPLGFPVAVAVFAIH